MTGLVTGESTELSGAVDLANLEESAWPTMSVGLANLAMVEMESAEPTGLVGLANWSVPAWKKLNVHASAVLEYENYAHRRHS